MLITYNFDNLRAPESLPSTDYLVVQHPSDRLQSSPGGLAMQSSPNITNLNSSNGTAQTGRSTIMVRFCAFYSISFVYLYVFLSLC